MKFLVIGCGSIGARHARNLASQRFGSIVLVDQDLQRAQTLQQEIGALDADTSYEVMLQKHPDITAVIIAAPTHAHAEIAEVCSAHGKHIFMEKPLAATLDEAQKLEVLFQDKELVFMMGQSFRFHEGLVLLKKMLDEQKIGKVTHVMYTSGQYLPDWHPHQDYRKEYAAQKSMGGGVLLTSFSHLFDMMIWLFGPITDLEGWKARLGNLDIDVDDSVFCTMKTSNNSVIQAESDFLQRKHTLAMQIFGTEGSISVDLMTHTLTLMHPGNKEEKIQYAFDANTRYIAELKHFVQLIENKQYQHNLDVSLGKTIMELLYSPKIKDLT